MKIQLLSLVALSILLYNCSGVSENTTNETDNDINQNEHHQHDEVQTIYLNNGEKWEVNDDMMPAILHMEESINTFSGSEEKDFKALAGILKEDIDLLTSNCTMTGQAHDELHKWLLPFIDMVNTLSEANNLNAEEIFNDIQNSFNTFNQYFRKSRNL